MNILGVTHPVSRNAAACLIKDGKLIAFAEEERFNRIKHSLYFPASKSIDYCLSIGKINLKDVDYIAIGWDTFLNTAKANVVDKVKSLFLRTSFLNTLRRVDENLNTTYSVTDTIRDYLVDYYHGLNKFPFDYKDKRVRFIRHHLAHAASVYYVSGFEKACIISTDGGGGQEAGILAVGEGKEIKVIKTIPAQHSLGHLYGSFTQLLGFEFHDGEGKVMGLASYGSKSAPLLPFVSFKNGIAVLDQEKERKFVSSIKKRLSKNPLDKINVNLASSLQKTLEKAYVYMAGYLYKETGIENFCLTGGVSLNCLANTKVLKLPFVKNLYIQPASSDAGTALGAALITQIDLTGEKPGISFEHPFWGPEFTNREIEKSLKKAGIPYYKKISNIETYSAKLLADGNILGWFQGRMEVGPRALGNRSILADPSKPKMNSIINNRIKGREPWRPFAPSILQEYAKKYLVDTEDSPFMVLESRVKTGMLKDIIAATHVDQTVRPQTVSKKTNSRYWKLIEEFRKITGIPAVLNTSFNLSGEPIVCTPMDAISTFYRCGLDYLVMGDFILAKNPINR